MKSKLFKNKSRLLISIIFSIFALAFLLYSCSPNSNGTSETYKLEITTENGDVTVTNSDGEKINDITEIKKGTKITLEAIPESDYGFLNWSGDISKERNPVTITIDSDLSITANFAELEGITETHLQEVASWMTGDFDNETQYETSFQFHRITLRMKRIWSDKQDGYWLYVEQAMYDSQYAPYRQRVYYLDIEDDKTVSSEIYTFASDEKEAEAIGSWENNDPLSSYTVNDLEKKDGCAVYLQKTTGDNKYKGSTRGKDCESSINGASYTTSIVTLYENALHSLDIGYDSNDEQVWGSEAGAYEFDKLRDFDSSLVVEENR